MSLPTVLALIALIASIVLVLQHRPIAFPAAALVASGLEVAMAFGLVHLSMSFARVPLALILGLVLLVAGGVVYVRSAAKPIVAASTAVALVGAVQVIAWLRFR